MSIKKWAERELDTYERVEGTKVKRNVIYKVIDTFKRQEHTGFTAGYIIGHLEALNKDYADAQNKLNALSKAGDYAQKLIIENIMEIYEIMKEEPPETQDICIKILLFKPLTPLLGTDDEWEEFGEGMYQNRRCFAVFKEVFEGGLEIPYYLDAYTYSDDGGISFFTSNAFGREEITFPFTIPVSRKKVFMYNPSEGMYYILTNPETIQHIKDNHWFNKIKYSEVLI